jgi:hypothetical protein
MCVYLVWNFSSCYIFYNLFHLSYLQGIENKRLKVLCASMEMVVLLTIRLWGLGIGVYDKYVLEA